MSKQPNPKRENDDLYTLIRELKKLWRILIREFDFTWDYEIKYCIPCGKMVLSEQETGGDLYCPHCNRSLLTECPPPETTEDWWTRVLEDQHG